MDSLDKAIAAAREALDGTHPGNDAMEHGRAELRDLLAALDAARGEPVAWVEAGDLEDVAENGYANTTMLAEDARGRAVGLVPLYAAPPAALAVPADVARHAAAAVSYLDHAGGMPAGLSLALQRLRDALAQQPAAALPEGYALVDRADIVGLCRILERDGDEHGAARELRAMLRAERKGE